ncbi:MAG TPA: 4-hydroxy-tetrahydrodipicolinate synthase [Candidatus Cybelea sp.]|nr:4-hydroxy-tetrahydrodipicolinate synthase [Candidatus Cybelea sp.]
MFKGSITALVTPFRNGAVDAASFQKFVAWQIAEGIDGVVPCGTTGESPTLSHEEHKRVVELCIEVAKGKVPVIAGTGSNSTDEAIDLTQHAERAGADAALVVLPYYNKPTPEGQYQHFKAIHDATNIPIVIYNVPPRTAVDMSVDTMARVAKLPRVIGVKDATADLARPIRTRIAIGKDFCQLSGEDGTALPFLAQGGVGCISVTANAAPKLTAQMQAAWRKGDVNAAMELNEKLMPLHDAMFCETNPGPVKFAVSLLGHCSSELRLPMAPIAETSRQKVEAAMKKVGLIGQ